MSRLGLERAAALVAGILFGVGLVVAGMTLPSKVVGFLDVLGEWDPTLAFVMGGAIAVHALAYRWVRGRPSPLLAARFQIPTRRDIDARLVLGAAIFGFGWGLGGYCPGPGIASLSSGHVEVLAFVVAMLAASWATVKLEERVRAREVARTRVAEAASTAPVVASEPRGAQPV